MGLELNAETPEEIAVSVLAEIIALRRGGTGRPMKVAQPEREPAA
jgi:xanthine dehydrogenase accessory factor